MGRGAAMGPDMAIYEIHQMLSEARIEERLEWMSLKEFARGDRGPGLTLKQAKEICERGRVQVVRGSEGEQRIWKAEAVRLYAEISRGVYNDILSGRGREEKAGS